MLRGLRPLATLAALVVTWPTLWAGFVTGAIPVTTALLRYLEVVVVFAVGLGFFDALVEHFRRSAGRLPPGRELPHRRRDD